MGMIADLFVKLGLNSTGFNQGIDQANKKTSMFGGAVKKIGGLIAGAFAVGAITSFIKEGIAGYGVQAAAEAKLASVIKSTGGVAGVTADQVKKYASELQKVTLYGDEVTINASAMMLTFTKIGKGVFPDAMKAAADMSTVLGTDLNGSVIQLGKALNDPIAGMNAMKRSGVSFSSSQIAMVKSMVESNNLLGAQKLILGELQTEFGGASEAAAKAGIGALTQLANTWGDIKEEVGKATVESKGFQDGVKDLGDMMYLIANKNISLWDKLAISVNRAFGTDASLKYLDYYKRLEAIGEDANSKKERNINAINEYEKSERQAQLQGVVKDGNERIDIAQRLAKAQQELSVMGPVEKGKQWTEAETEGWLRKKEAIYAYEQELKKLEEIERENNKTKQKATTANELYNLTLAELKDNLLLAKNAAAYPAKDAVFAELSENINAATKALDEFQKAHKKTVREIAPAEMSGAKGFNFGTAKQDDGSGTKVGDNGLFETAKTDVPGLDMSGIGRSMKANGEAIKEAGKDIIDPVKEFNDELNNTIKDGMANAVMTFGEGLGALMSGDMNMGEFGASLLGVIGDFMSQMGQLMITTAIGMIALDLGIKSMNPFLLLAGGAALMAVGGAISSLASKGLSGSSSGGGGGSSAASGYSYSSGGSSAAQALSGNVVFELQGNTLKGALNNTDRKNQNFR